MKKNKYYTINKLKKTAVCLSVALSGYLKPYKIYKQPDKPNIIVRRKEGKNEQIARNGN